MFREYPSHGRWTTIRHTTKDNWPSAKACLTSFESIHTIANIMYGAIFGYGQRDMEMSAWLCPSKATTYDRLNREE